MYSPADRRARSGRLLVVALTIALLVGAGCADDSTAGSNVSPTTAATGNSSLVAPAAFEQRVATAGVVTINVHVPNEGSIPGTDLVIPFDQISTSAELPVDRRTPLAVYCRSGNMSADAVRDLVALGYTDIVQLEGGFNAWKATGRALLAPGA